MLNFSAIDNNSKFRKGQIWWVKKNRDEEEERTKDPNYHLTTKTRPWLIVSDDHFININRVVSMVLVITNYNRNDLHPANVKIYVNENIRYAKCSEIQTLNLDDINGEYVTTLTDKSMSKVDEALSMYLGIKSEPSLKDLELIIRAKIDRINAQRHNEDSQINDIVDKMQELLNISGVDIQLSSHLTPHVDVNTKGKTVSGNSDKYKKKQYRNWTVESMEDFCNLYKTNKDELVKKYNVSAKTAVTYYYKFRKELSK